LIACLLEGNLVELRLVTLLFLATINVRVKVEQQKIRIIQNRFLELLQGTGCFAREVLSIRFRIDARLPGVQLDVGYLRQPQQCRQVVASHVLLVSACVFAIQHYGGNKLR
jgi:hypothetical protein